MADNTYQNSTGTEKKGLTNGWRIAIIAVLAALIISPVDIISGDILTGGVGLIDDVAYLVGIITTVVNMINGRKATSVDNAQGGSYTPPMYNDVDSNEKR